MEVLEIKIPKNVKIIVYMAKSEKEGLQNGFDSEIITFIEEKKIKFVTMDFQINIKVFQNTDLGKALEKKIIPFYQLDIPEYAMGYIYQEIIEKEDFMNGLCDEYESMQNKDSYKGESLRNWIDMLHEEIQQKENYISLKLRPQWIVKKMLDLVKAQKTERVIFLYYVQTDICEDICPQVTQQLREVGIKVINYNVKKHLKDIITKI